MMSSSRSSILIFLGVICAGMYIFDFFFDMKVLADVKSFDKESAAIIISVKNSTSLAFSLKNSSGWPSGGVAKTMGLLSSPSELGNIQQGFLRADAELEEEFALQRNMTNVVATDATEVSTEPEPSAVKEEVSEETAAVSNEPEPAAAKEDVSEEKSVVPEVPVESPPPDIPTAKPNNMSRAEKRKWEAKMRAAKEAQASENEAKKAAEADAAWASNNATKGTPRIESRQERNARKEREALERAKKHIAENPVAAPPVTYSNATSDKEIPKILHFIWVSRGFPDDQPPVQEHFMDNIRGWQALNPGYEVKIWKNANFKKEFPELAAFLQAVPTMAMVSDLLRYYAISKYGGIYLDMDIAPIKSLEYLRTITVPVFAVCELTGSKRGNSRLPKSEADYVIQRDAIVRGKKMFQCTQTNNNVIGSVPGHPALTQVIQNSLNNVRDSMLSCRCITPGYTLKVTGPKAWFKCVTVHKDIQVLSVGLFHPCDFFSRGRCDAEDYKKNGHIFGMHEWKGSWKKAG